MEGFASKRFRFGAHIIYQNKMRMIAKNFRDGGNTGIKISRNKSIAINDSGVATITKDTNVLSKDAIAGGDIRGAIGANRLIDKAFDGGWTPHGEQGGHANYTH